MSILMPITVPENIKPANTETQRHGENLKKKSSKHRWIHSFLPKLSQKCFLHFSVALFLCVSSPFPAFCSDDPLIDADRASTIEFLLERAITHKLISGGIVLVGNRKGTLYTATRGNIGVEQTSPPITVDTLFDIASLTKVFATAPAIMKLLEEGKLSLMDPITRWFPELNDSGREETTILNLLTHTSGLHDVSMQSPSPMANLLLKATRFGDSPTYGNRFLYADINFILLAELVQRAAGIPFDQFCREQLYFPLEMNKTGFLPQKEFHGTIAPTVSRGNVLNSGVVQDENARLLGGIAGHAGLFSSASDLSRFAMMILNSGATGGGNHVFSERVMSQMTAPYFYNNGKIIRGLGWDIHSPYSSPRGNSFSDMSFGHTGYSGSSVWIDPEQDIFVILLTIRLDYHDKRKFNRFRSDISTLATTLFAHPALTSKLLETAVSSDLLKP